MFQENVLLSLMMVSQAKQQMSTYLFPTAKKEDKKSLWCVYWNCLRVCARVKCGRWLTGDCCVQATDADCVDRLLQCMRTAAPLFSVSILVELSHTFTIQVSRDSSVVRVIYLWLKGLGFETQQEWQENFLLQGKLSALTYFNIHSTPVLLQ